MKIYSESPNTCVPDVKCEASLTECVDFEQCINPGGTIETNSRANCAGTSCITCTDGVDCTYGNNMTSLRGQLA